MKIEQIRSTDGTGTLSYLLIDTPTSSAVLIDPNIEDVHSISELIQYTKARLTHIIDTHTHADHVSGAGKLQQAFGAKIVMHESTKNKWKIIDQGDKFGIGDTLRANAKIPIDEYVNDGDMITSGTMQVKILFTPGHTDNHITMQVDENIFTGDLLLIGQAGRSDLPGGSAEEQYNSLTNKILPLPEHTKMYPGHDYENKTFALLGDEKRTNPFLKRRTKAEYIQFVQDFFPPLAEASASGGKMTLQCGVQRVAQATDRFKNISADELQRMITERERLTLLDVREPLELMMSGAIEGVQNISVRQLMNRTRELPEDKSTTIVSICASGSRSIEAAHMLQELGYVNVMNLADGTNGWIQSGYPVVRPIVTV
jgi:glyoxylase-like metal-dependent hydrolase (beta-lactamase superfamily II)/rhodanese-related sulfurtransferase